MLGALNHVAVAVPDLPAAISFYENLGAEISGPQDLPEHGVTVVFIQLPNTKIELLHPLGPDSPIASFLAKNPAGGIHHLCFETPDLADARSRMTAGGVRILGNGKDAIGAHGVPVFFAHPKDTLGTLMEFEAVKP